VSAFTTFLRIVAPILVLVGALHLFLGLNADVMLGARLTADVLADPALDSQNRFYGTSFMLYGVIAWLSATDLVRYATVLRCLLWVLFAAGAARLVSISVRGTPPPLVLVLLALELATPPAVLWWLSRTLSSAPKR
jgi:hypothetical protein